MWSRASSTGSSVFLPCLQPQDEKSLPTWRSSLVAIVPDGFLLFLLACASWCLQSISQYTINDPCVSNKHLRIYTIIYDDDNPTEVAPLVYAEDLSRNGTYWNGSLIGKGNGGFLLSDGDTLRLSSHTLLRFEHGAVEEEGAFDLTQETEMMVCGARSPSYHTESFRRLSAKVM